jgi:hypothetical protein
VTLSKTSGLYFISCLLLKRRRKKREKGKEEKKRKTRQARNMRIATKAVLHQTAKPRRGIIQCVVLGSMTKEPGWAEIEGDGKWMHRRADLERSNWDEA